MVDSRRIAFFAALCMFFSLVETLIPKPVPFFRVGLANLPVMLSLACFSRKETLVLCACKIMFQALVSGTLFSYIFLLSVCGSVCSCLAMMMCHFLFGKAVSWIAVSLCGAFASSGSQLAAAGLFFGDSVGLVAPVLLVISLFSGLSLGVFANLFTQKSKWWREL